MRLRASHRNHTGDSCTGLFPEGGQELPQYEPWANFPSFPCPLADIIGVPDKKNGVNGAIGPTIVCINLLEAIFDSQVIKGASYNRTRDTCDACSRSLFNIFAAGPKYTLGHVRWSLRLTRSLAPHSTDARCTGLTWTGASSF